MQVGWVKTALQPVNTSAQHCQKFVSIHHDMHQQWLLAEQLGNVISSISLSKFH